MIRVSSGRFGHSARFFPLALAALLAVLAAVVPAHADDLRGRVLDPHSRPVPGATVLVLRGARVVATAVTNGDGGFGPLNLPSGDYAVVASSPGLGAAPVPVTLTAGPGFDVDVRLGPSVITETVVVSAAQIDVPLSRATSSVVVIDREEIGRRQIETVADVIRGIPGFGVVASGGRGALTSIFPRGGESDYTLVLADGVPQNAFGGAFDAAHLPTSDLERVEVVRGPQSALFGGGAIGGIVQLITRRGGPWRGDVIGETGAYGTTRMGGGIAGSAGSWTMAGSAERLASDGDTRTRASIGGPVSNDDYERRSVTASLGWSDRPGRRARVDVRRTRSERGFPGAYGSDPLGIYGGLDTISRGENDVTTIAGSAALRSGPVQHSALLTWSDMPSRFESPYGASIDQTRRLTGRYQIDIDGLPAGVSAGMELLREQADNTFITGELFQAVPVRRLVTGWFGETRWTLGARGDLHAGVRLERIERRSLEGDPNPFGPRPAFASDVVWSANPKIAAAWAIRESGVGGWTRLRASAGTGIKPPTAFEIAFTDNPGLAPERSRSLDAGVEHAFAGATVLVDATWFLNRYDDLIVAVGSSLTGASRYRTDNISNAVARGLETGVTWQPRFGVRVRAGWTWLRTEIRGVDNLPNAAPRPFMVGDALVRRAPHRASVEAAWTGGRGSIFADVQGRGRMDDLEPNFASTIHDNPGFSTTTVGGTIHLRRGVEVFGRVINLFDREYEEVLGFPSLGRSAHIGIRLAAGR